MPTTSTPGGKFQAVFYRAADGSQPVAIYLASQPTRARVILDNQIDRLNDLSPSRPHLPHPWSSQVRGELRELRLHVGNEHHRVLFARSNTLFVLLHAFPKRTKQLTEEDIEIAEARWTDFHQRMDEKPRRPPRAAGGDAPRRANQRAR